MAKQWWMWGLLLVFGGALIAAEDAEPAAQPARGEPTHAKPTEEGECTCDEDQLKERGGHVGPPCFCLQEKYMEFPGSSDLYTCLTMETEADCTSGNGENELWYGTRRMRTDLKIAKRKLANRKDSGIAISASRSSSIALCLGTG